METSEATELCFPQLYNTSCRRALRSPVEAMLLYTVLSLVALLTVALNLLVIISITHFRQLYTPTNLVLLSLACSDFFIGLLIMPFEGLHSIGACWFLGYHVCALSYSMSFILTSASVGNMLLISVDRYVAICNPLRYPATVTPGRVKISVCLCWVCSVLYNCLILKENLIAPWKNSLCQGDCIIVIGYISGAVDLTITFLIPVTVVVVLYTRVFVVAISQARHILSQTVSTRSTGGTVVARKSERKAARTLGVVVVVFLICFCPYYYPAFSGHNTPSNKSASAFVIWLLNFNSCLNPLIYAFFYPWFRKAMKLIVTLQILKPHSSESKMF